ncbi:MAG: TPM domain-containing protein [Bdellovibrionales bacterium]|nr:TPM domain-containing protein [Bdellovibrionales bacterium]
MKRKTLVILLIIFTAMVIELISFVVVIKGFGTDRNGNKERTFELTDLQRPSDNDLLVDKVGLLSSLNESTTDFLNRLRERFKMDTVLVTLPTLPNGITLNQYSLDLFNRWKIGKSQAGRGLLLLFVDDVKRVRIEVSYELEDVFTDAFVGFIQDIQLEPNYKAGQLEVALIAVMEEIEKRAQIKLVGQYDKKLISQLDQELLAGGAGAERALKRYVKGSQLERAPRGNIYRAASTPEEAWQVLLKKWAGEGENIPTQIYSEVGKVELGDPNEKEARTMQRIPHWRSASYEILSDGQHAVVSFGDRDGWDNAPFLFMKGPNGWVFDIVYQRRLVVMGSNPYWLTELGDFPYVSLFKNKYKSFGKDIPLEEKDIYTVERDLEWAQRIKELQRLLASNPKDAASYLELGRLNALTSRRPGHVYSNLNKALELDPSLADAHKYLAIFNAFSNFQYKTSLQNMHKYVEAAGPSVFAYNFLGFLYFQTNQLDRAEEYFSKSVKLNPENCYANAKLARLYAVRAKKAGLFSLFGNSDSDMARQMYSKAKKLCGADSMRVLWLKEFIDSKGI